MTRPRMRPWVLIGLCAGLVINTGCDPNRDLATYTCGNGICDSGEDPASCSADCQANTCGNNICEVGEDGAGCPADCMPTICGDGTCDAPTENPASCPADCSWAACGNGVCEAGEENSCVEDCFADLCGNQICDYSEDPATCPQDCSAVESVDILFVIDNSGSMAGEQTILRYNFQALYEALRSSVGALPDLHVGVTSTDLGTGMFQITYCEEVGGDAGDLLAPPYANLTGANWMIDRAPQGCSITRETNGTCTAHQCNAAHCPADGTAPLQLVEDAATGCPRCQNFLEPALDTFSALADLGTMGCGFEQPLEAMYKALEPSHPANSGFLRPDALLAVVFITDEDDCSASNQQLYDNTQTDLNSTLGPLTSYRCFEFGVTCDINSRTHLGTRQNCVPREDPAALLHPVSRYTNFLYGLKGPGELLVSVIGGPVTESPNGMGYNMVVGLDDQSNPDLQYSCTTAVDGAVPGIRLASLVNQFMSPDQIAGGAYSSVCSADYTPALQAVGNYLRDRLGE